MSYTKLAPLNDVISELIASKPATEVSAFRKSLYNDLNIDNMLGALESTINEKTGKCKLATKLTEDCMQDHKEFAEIMKCGGDITKLKQYDIIAAAIEFINERDETYKMSASIGNDVGTYKNFGQNNIRRMNKLNDILTTFKTDFVFGFKTNNKLIINTFCSLVCVLVDSVSINMATLTKFMNEEVSGEGDPGYIKMKVNGAHLNVFRYADRLCDMFDDGTWARLVKEFKNNIGKNFTGITAATIGGAIIIAAAVPIAMVALLYMIRALITFYFESAVSLNEKCKAMKEYLEVASSTEPNEKAKHKQEKMIRKLESISGFLTSKILKEDDKGKIRIQEQNRAIDIDTYIPPTEKGAIVFE